MFICICLRVNCEPRPIHWRPSNSPTSRIRGRLRHEPPVLEVADIFRAWVGCYIDRYGPRISWPQLKVIRAIERCRTAALGRHRDRCTGCGKDFGFSFNSCLMGSNF